jgi:hypothetical protein
VGLPPWESSWRLAMMVRTAVTNSSPRRRSPIPGRRAEALTTHRHWIATSARHTGGCNEHHRMLSRTVVVP